MQLSFASSESIVESNQTWGLEGAQKLTAESALGCRAVRHSCSQRRVPSPPSHRCRKRQISAAGCPGSSPRYLQRPRLRNHWHFNPKTSRVRRSHWERLGFEFKGVSPTHPSIYPRNHSSPRLCIQPFTHSSVYPINYLLIHSLNNPSTHRFIHPPTYLLINSLIYLSMHPFSHPLIYRSILSVIHTSATSIHSFTHPLSNRCLPSKPQGLGGTYVWTRGT